MSAEYARIAVDGAGDAVPEPAACLCTCYALHPKKLDVCTLTAERGPRCEACAKAGTRVERGLVRAKKIAARPKQKRTRTWRSDRKGLEVAAA